MESCQIQCIFKGRQARGAGGWDVGGEEKREVKERLGWAAISRLMLGKAKTPCQWAKKC